MKKINLLLIASLVLVTGLFSSCEKTDSTNEVVIEGNALIANYGSYGGAKGEFSLFNETEGIITNNYFKTINNIDFQSCIQSIGKHNGKLYSMSNNADGIDIINLSTFKVEESIDDNIVKPRYFAAKGNKAYISCWGNVADWSKMLNSYIAIIDLTTNQVTKVDQAGGFEGIAIVGDKLYAASYTKPEVAVLNLSTEKFETPIKLNSQARHFAVAGDKLWVSHVSSYSIHADPENIGIACINTNTNKVEKKVNIPEIGGNGYLATNNDSSKIYVMGNEAYPSKNSSIISVNGTSGVIENKSFITGESFYGMGFNKTTDKLYVLISPSTSSNGKVQVYDTKGTKLKEATTGIAPQHVIFY